MFARALLLLCHGALADHPAGGLAAVANGRFLLAEAPPAYQPRLDTAVERAIASLHFAIRPLARHRLRPAVYETVCADLSLHLTEELFAVQCAGDEPETRHFDGRDSTFTDGGDPYRVTFAFEGRSLTVTYAGPRGGQSNTYEFDAAGALRLHGSIFSSSLPEPLRWTLPYRRQGP
jgi:hypothetical protein